MNAIIRTFTLPLLAIAMQPVFAAQPEQATRWKALPTKRPKQVRGACLCTTTPTADGCKCR